ncbi:hypothetical protein [Actinomadura harenae]|uniref:Uncharacterized protein n=1 Tax=Actinomadura harenae TaxID=2483351 RepID=A0A3M2LSQ8_9ACTN|nr:hypothetical protein [Actinomadura harenae]RMI39900.1 hypothetical protein EBO15_28455 [Actinomadura harenae]
MTIPIDTETGEIQVRPFADILRDLGRGSVIDQAAVLLQDLVRAVQERGKKGTFSLRVEIQPMKGDSNALVVSAKAEAKPPAGEPTSAVFFSDEHGNLLREDPRQLKISLREVTRPTTPDTKDLKQA